MAALTIASSVKLSSGGLIRNIDTELAQALSGYTLPLLGFGVYQNYDARPSVLDAFKAGYR